MYTLLNKLSDSFDMLCKKIGAGLLAAMVALIVVQVIARYIVGSSLSWSEEIARFLFIWIVMLGAAIGVHDGSHVAVGFILQRLPVPLRRLTMIFFTLCLCLLTAVMVRYGGALAARVHLQLAPATRIPMAYVYAAVPVCSAGMFVHFVVQLMQILSNTAKRSN